MLLTRLEAAAGKQGGWIIECDNPMWLARFLRSLPPTDARPFSFGGVWWVSDETLEMFEFRCDNFATMCRSVGREPSVRQKERERNRQYWQERRRDQQEREEHERQQREAEERIRQQKRERQQRKPAPPPPRGVMNPYRLLGIKSGATLPEIKKAYRALALKHHPDHGGDIELMKRINLAYEKLTKGRR